MTSGVKSPPEKRLHDKYVVDADSGCWIWTSKINTNGYGIIAGSMEGGRRGREYRAHRLMFAMARGPVPSGYDLDHLCRNRRCVNPDHLEPVTRAENLRRGGGEHSRGKTHCKRGHEFTPENTYITRSGYRNCRTCARDYQRRLRAQRPAYATSSRAFPTTEPTRSPRTSSNSR